MPLPRLHVLFIFTACVDIPYTLFVLKSCHPSTCHLILGEKRPELPLLSCPCNSNRNRRWMAERGITNCVELSWWEEIELPAGNGGEGAVRVACTPAQHWSTRTVLDRNDS